MKRLLLTALVVVFFGLSAGFAQDVVLVNHDRSHGVVVDGSCANGQCGACNDCVRITEIKVNKHPVYACAIKEICIPNCGGLFRLFNHGCQDGCTKIEVRQLVKKYRSEEECVSKCVTAEEAAKHYEAEAKKAADKAKSQMPAPAPGKLPAGAVRYAPEAPLPVSFAPTQPRLGSFFGVRKN